MKKFLVLTAFAAFAFGAFPQQTKLLTAEKHNEYGLVYSLPTTALVIDVTARHEVRKAGPFVSYARRYLGTSDVVREDSERWYVTKISVTPVGVKDDDTQYLMQLKPGALTFLGVSASNGMLLSINASPEAQVLPPAVSQFPVVISEGGDINEFLEYVDMDFVSAQNSMRQAEMVASSMMDVRDAYLSLTRDTSDEKPSDRQMELMLTSLDRQHKALKRAFAGTVSIEEVSRQYTYIPEEDGEEILLRLSDFAGFVESDDLSGAPLYIKTEVLMEGALPLDAEGEPKKFPKDGVVYAIPGTAKISVYTDETGFYNKEMEFAQFGTKFGLSPSLFTDKKAPSFARFSPVTGALLELGKAEKHESPVED